jgi:hypothetical protein
VHQAGNVGRALDRFQRRCHGRFLACPRQAREIAAIHG